MRRSLCTLLMVILPALIMGRTLQNQPQRPWSPQQIDDAWMMVPWTNGGFYFHNTLTREDQDHRPSCLSKSCKWAKKN